MKERKRRTAVKADHKLLVQQHTEQVAEFMVEKSNKDFAAIDCRQFRTSFKVSAFALAICVQFIHLRVTSGRLYRSCVRSISKLTCAFTECEHALGTYTRVYAQCVDALCKAHVNDSIMMIIELNTKFSRKSL